ncbi:uncharacterized protein LOC131598361 [Vicia villosa]|uniref:uncharacterized protein LOC131598361 n=1 Tax=Vicia villosa TaxID=3911 RepID=UPI00273BEE1F|nr:uncharacterized protein LOC131598361 [Vicia villosa]
MHFVVSFKDCEGRKLMQPVEYEWKPLYYDRCQSIGHKCKDYVKKQWMPKGKPLESAPSSSLQGTTSVEEPIQPEKGIEPKHLEKGTEDAAWIEARSTIKDRGKRILTRSSFDINCVSGFEALGVLNDLIVTLDRGPFKIGKSKLIRDKLNVYDSYVDNYHNHDNGRIWISWNDNLDDVKVIQSSDQYLHCGIYDTKGTFQFWLTAIYRKNRLEQRKILWKDIANMRPNVQDPWCLMGDFNNVMRAQDRMGGRMVTDFEYVDLLDMMTHTGLTEMDGCGDYDTWCNRHTNDTIYSRIDILIGNVESFKKYNDMNLRILAPIVSDHALLQVVNETQKVINNRRFKFYNRVIELASYEEVVKKSWDEPLDGSPMFILWRKL